MPDTWERVADEYACQHPNTVLTVKVAVNGVKSYCHQCRRCGQGLEVLRHVALTAAQKAGAVPFDEELKSRWWKLRGERYSELKATEEAARKREFDAWYSRYLLTPEWRGKRARVFRRAGGICEGCREQPATQVHHLTYARVGNELLFDLVAICDRCHRIAHPEPDSEGRSA